MIGLWLVKSRSTGGVFSACCFSNPVLVSFVKNKYWVYIFLKSGSTVDEGVDNKRMFPKDVTKGISDAVNLAVQRYRVENDPRKELHL